MIPAEIVIICGFAWCGFKIVKWWQRAHEAKNEAVRLSDENAELRETIIRQEAALANAVRPAQSSKPAP